MILPLYPTEVDKCKTRNHWVLFLAFKNVVLHSPIYQGLQQECELGVALLKLLWKTWDSWNIVRPTCDTNLSRSESSMACIDCMCGWRVSQDEHNMSRYVFTSGLSSLEDKKVHRTTHSATAASNGYLNGISSWRINCEKTLFCLFIQCFRCQLHPENKIGAVRWQNAIRSTKWSLCCNTQDAGWLHRSLFRYATWVMTEKVYE
jgi:hypothetical protein